MARCARRSPYCGSDDSGATMRKRCGRLRALRKRSRDGCGLRLRKRYGATTGEALCARRLRKRYGARLRKRSGETAAEALWRDACALWSDAMLRKQSGAMPADALWRDAEALWRDDCGSALVRTSAYALRRRYDASSTEAL